jgi:hypothetical protein
LARPSESGYTMGNCEPVNTTGTSRFCSIKDSMLAL